ncbi:universal stress protein [Pseudonocardia sp. RS010]|uniref:universal stress protein n=1 Tax=Pseudonocardia sp. RS010 TaxID=3385979 RepID=UPI0039A1CD53
MSTETEGSGAEVVVGVDGTPASRSALRWALDRADRRGGAVLAVTVADTPPPPVGAGGAAALPPQDLTAAAAAELEGMVTEEAAGRSAPVRTRVLTGDPVTGLAEQARSARLLVLGNRGGERLGGVVGSVGRSCGRQVDCPTARVPADGGRGAEPVLVVGMEGTEHSRAALRWAVGEAGPAERVEAVAVQYEPFPHGGGQADPDFEEDAHRAVAGALEGVPAPATVDVVALRGAPSEVLLARAVDRQALVLGNAQRPALGDAVVGSVMGPCLRHAVGPVVLVPG